MVSATEQQYNNSMRDAAVHPQDTVNVGRTLDVAVIDYLNSNKGKYNFPIIYRMQPKRLVVHCMQCLLIFFFIGIPKYFKVNWSIKRYFVWIPLVAWYILMLIKEFVYENSYEHIICSNHKLKVLAHFNLKEETYNLTINKRKLNSIFVFDVFSPKGEFNFSLFESSFLS